MATLALLSASAPTPARAADDAQIARGKRVLEASGGCTCHTDVKGGGAPLSGGRPMKTPFGVFYSTNITPDPETGIGRWTDADFLRAMHEGRSPTGTAYFPVFPYTSFTGMSDDDVLALKAYLFSLAPVVKPNREPDAPPPFSWRIGAWMWQLAFFTPKRFAPDATKSPAWNRGAYLSTAVAHCGECHTPRNLAGALDRAQWMIGSEDGPEGELAPNITPDPDTGIGNWTRTDLVWFLQTASMPDGDDSTGLMKEVIESGYTHAPETDLQAIGEYLESLAPVRNELLKKKHEQEHEHER